MYHLNRSDPSKRWRLLLFLMAVGWMGGCGQSSSIPPHKEKKIDVKPQVRKGVSPPYRLIAKLTRKLPAIDWSSNLPVEKTIEFRLSFPYFQTNTERQPESGPYTILCFLAQEELKKTNPDFSPLVIKARSFVDAYYRARGLIVVAQAMSQADHKSESRVLIKEATALTESAVKNKEHIGDLRSFARFVLRDLEKSDRKGRMGKIQASRQVRDVNWRKKALQVADQASVQQPFATYGQSRVLSDTRRPRQYFGTRVGVAAQGLKRIAVAKRIALIMTNRDYLPEDRLEAYRFLFEGDDRWIQGWFGAIVEMKQTKGSNWYVRVSMSPAFHGKSGGVSYTPLTYLETWRFNATTGEMAFLGGSAYGLEGIMGD